MRGCLRNLLGALLLSSVVGCAGGFPEEAGEATGSDLSQAEAASALEQLVAHPETNLRGVGDSVASVAGKQDTWSFYPFHPTTAGKAKAVADDSESVFLVVGSTGAMFVIDLETGAFAGTAPEGTDLDTVTRRLKADLLASDLGASDLGTAALAPGALHVTGLPGANLVGELAGKLVEKVAAGAGKLLEADTYKSVATAAKETTSKVVSFFSRSEDKAAATKAAEPATTAVGKAVEKIGDNTKGKVKVKVAKTEPGTAVVVRKPTDLEILKAKTSGPVAVSVDDGIALVRKQTSSAWSPEPDITDLVATWQHPKGVSFLVDPSLSAAEQKVLTDAGFTQVWVLPAETVADMSTLKIAIGATDSIIETRSASAARAVVQAAENYLVKGWDESILALSDNAFIETPAFKVIEAIGSRALDGVENLPKTLVIGGKTLTESTLDKTIARAVALMKNMGLGVSAATVKSRMSGFQPAAIAGGSPGPVTDSGKATAVTASTDNSDGTSNEPTAAEESNGPVAHKASSSGGCAAAPGSTTAGDVGGLALGLAVLLVARRRRRS